VQLYLGRCREALSRADGGVRRSEARHGPSLA
jgi:hypothetical protein